MLYSFFIEKVLKIILVAPCCTFPRSIIMFSTEMCIVVQMWIRPFICKDLAVMVFPVSFPNIENASFSQLAHIYVSFTKLSSMSPRFFWVCYEQLHVMLVELTCPPNQYVVSKKQALQLGVFMDLTDCGLFSQPQLHRLWTLVIKSCN